MPKCRYKTMIVLPMNQTGYIFQSIFTGILVLYSKIFSETSKFQKLSNGVSYRNVIKFRNYLSHFVYLPCSTDLEWASYCGYTVCRKCNIACSSDYSLVDLIVISIKQTTTHQLSNGVSNSSLLAQLMTAIIRG